jgi:hypothetical protein
VRRMMGFEQDDDDDDDDDGDDDVGALQRVADDESSNKTSPLQTSVPSITITISSESPLEISENHWADLCALVLSPAPPGVGVRLHVTRHTPHITDHTSHAHRCRHHP